MKLKKLILLVPMLVSLAACNGNNKTYAGKYSFQLGNDKTAHTGINLTLTDDPAEVELDPSIEAKQFQLEFKIKGKEGKEGEKGTSFFSVVEEFSSLIKEYTATDVSETSESTSSDTSESGGEDVPTTINGYYYVSQVEYKESSGKVVKQNRLYMGVQVLDGVNISPDIVEKILYATIDDTTLNVVIPVSIMDFLFQLYWYGYRISSIEELLSPTDLEVESHGLMKHNQIGTHPTEDDVNDIIAYQDLRKSQASDYHVAEAVFLDYRDFHTLNMGLLKDGTK